MIGNLLWVFTAHGKLAGIEQFGEILGDVNDLKGYLEFRVFVLEGVVTVGRRNKDCLHAMVDKGLDVLPGQFLEEFLIAGLADALAAAVLLLTQDPEIDVRFLEDLDGSLGYLFQPRVIAAVTAGPVEDIHPFLEGFYGKSFCPGCPGLAVFIEGVALILEP